MVSTDDIIMPKNKEMAENIEQIKSFSSCMACLSCVKLRVQSLVCPQCNCMVCGECSEDYCKKNSICSLCRKVEIKDMREITIVEFYGI